MMSLRSTFLVLAIMVASPVVVYAQTGGLPSSTAPSNSEGTPSGGTGVLSTTQVQPTSTPVASRSHSRHRRHRHHRAHHSRN